MAQALVRLALAASFVAVPSAAAQPTVPSFDHIVVVVFENKEYSSVIGNPAAPTFNAMAKKYALLTRYYGVSHPSLPNYLALASGSTQGITSDCTMCTVAARNLVDTLQVANKTWKIYAEGLPRPGFTGAYAGRYAKKHLPFLYFRDIVRDPARLAFIVPYTQLGEDLRADAVPDFLFVVPDLCHSMHDCSVAAGDRWLRSALPPLLRLPNTAVFIVFDEGNTDVRGGGHVPALVVGSAVRPHARFTSVTSHYGLLRTVEAAWGLSLLGHSARATPITGIWR